ncbi:MAG: DUF6913 domain-containing protein [Bacteroidota bacterium]
MKKYKLKIANWLLKKEVRAVKRKKEVHNFDDANSVGVLFSAEQPNAFDVTNEFLHYLAHKKLQIFVLGYIPKKEIPKEFLMNSKINFLCKKDISWIHKPKSHVASKFITREFDILFDLSDIEHFPLKYINNLSRAKFKVGKEPTGGREYDFMINIRNNPQLSYYVEQVKEYIEKINKEK